MQNQTVKCADAASENCPCLLAETGDCLVCSRMRGLNECDCDWTGVCIYNEFILNGKKRALPRAEEKLKIIKTGFIPDSPEKAVSAPEPCTEKETGDYKEGGFMIMEMDCTRGFALKCLNPGTHIFIRPAEREKYYDTPLSILAADRTAGTLTVCFRIISAKTKALAGCGAGDTVSVRGPFRNGITGLKRNMTGLRVLIAASGAGTVPAVFTSNLISGANRVDLLIDGGHAEKQLIRMYLSESGLSCPAEIHFRDFSRELCCTDDPAALSGYGSAAAFFSGRKNEYDEIIILGSDSFITFFRAAAETFTSAHIACSNNAPMSCGEGICGACLCTQENGGRSPRCKCSLLHTKTV